MSVDESDFVESDELADAVDFMADAVVCGCCDGVWVGAAEFPEFAEWCYCYVEFVFG